MKQILYMFISCISFSAIAQENNTLIVDFESIKYDKGKLFVALYTTQDSFLKKRFRETVVEVTNGKATAVFKNLKLGTYAVSSFYDKNDNGKLDTNFLEIPREPTAMNNNAKRGVGPPKYKHAKFNIVSEEKR